MNVARPPSASRAFWRGPCGFAAFVLLFHTTPLAAEVVSTCVECHANLTDATLRDPVGEIGTSVHASGAVGCMGCHKGDPGNPTVGAHDPRKGFVAHPSAQATVSICGGCHEDARMLLRFGIKLPTDQRALYEKSQHGKLVAQGDARGPTCATCHGIHDIAKVGSATSRVAARNVALLCASCHASAARMAPSTLPTDQYMKWQRSAHADALGAGNPAAPACTGCHGGHFAMRPQLVSVAPACGRCHKDELDLFEASSHSKPFAKLGFDPCVPCHGNHDVVRTSARLLGVGADASCGKCHAADDKPNKTARELRSVVDGAERRGQLARAAVRRAETAGLFIGDAVTLFADLGAAERRLRAAVHKIDPAALADEAEKVTQAADRAEASVRRAVRAQRVKGGAGYAAGGIAVVLALLLIVRKVRRHGA